MKTILFVCLLLVNSVAIAENPSEMFPTDNNFTDTSKITWKQVDNVQAVCDKQHISTDGKPYGYKVLACSSWTKSIFGDKCEIITGKRTSLHIIGHEVRHCFQGDFHK